MHKKNKMKIIALLALAIPVTAGTSLAHAAGLFSSEESVSLKGTVERFLLNPEGVVDGFLLSDGTQVNVPPHLSGALTAAVAKGDAISLKGIRHSKTLVKADLITNDKTQAVVKDEGPGKGPKGGPMGGPMGRPGGPKGSKGGPRDNSSMTEMSASGKVQRLLTGPRGEVNGAILADDTIVRIPPHLADKQKLEVGKELTASGFGTQNDYGRVLQVTKLNGAE